MPPHSPHKRVVAYNVNPAAAEHEVQTNLAQARWLAEILGWPFDGPWQPAAQGHPGLYFVPSQTLVGPQREQLAIDGAEDLLGGYVQHGFIATKAISHPLISEGTGVPAGWNPQFAERVRDVVLPGVTVFDLGDARRAAAEGLTRGVLRVKLVEACGGEGQALLRNDQDLKQWLAGLSPAICAAGIVLEENLEQAITHSVGQTLVDGLLMTYFGEQFQTRNGRGECVYAGSRLTVVRGDYVDLLARDLAADVRRAVEYARTYDTAAALSFPGFFASRRNYDVVQGIGADGQQKVGVLEQSWRVGGATGAELAALQAFVEQPTRNTLCASTHEVHTEQDAPAQARVLFRGRDTRGGFLLKYAEVDADDRQQ